MTHSDALKRLALCRELQKDEMQVVVAAEIVDALLAPRSACEDCCEPPVSREGEG
jgi:hypothetical protein